MQFDLAKAQVPGAADLAVYFDGIVTVTDQAGIHLQGARGATEQFIQGNAGDLRGQVPQRDIDARQCIDHRSRRAKTMQGTPGFFQSLLALVQTSTDKHRPHDVRQRLERHGVGAMAKRLTPTDHTAVGSDLEHQAFHTPVAWGGGIEGVVFLGFAVVLPELGTDTERDTDADYFDAANDHRSGSPAVIGFMRLRLRQVRYRTR